MTDFDAMTHDQIYAAVKAGQLDALATANTAITDMHKTVTDHMTAMETILKKLNGAWTDEGGTRLYNAMSGTVNYVHRIQSAHVVESAGSITQVLAASHEKLSTTQTTIPEPPVTPVAAQKKNFERAAKEQGDAMSMRTANMLTKMSQAQADDKKAVAMAKALANTYKAEAAKMNTPEPTPKTGPNLPGGSGTQPSGTGSGRPSTGGSGVGSYSGPAPTGQWSPSGGYGGQVTQLPPDPTSGSPIGSGGYPGNNVDNGGTGATFDGGTGGTGGTGTSDSTTTGLGTYGGGNGGLPSGVLTGAAVLGGAAALAKAAAATRAQQLALSEQRALAQQQLATEENGGAMSFQRQAALNAQQRGILAGEQSMMSQEQRALAAQQRSILASERGALTAEERAMMAAGQRGVVPGQLGGSTGAGAAGARSMGRGGFSPHGVVGGENAERVTWLVEDRDLYGADPGVKPVLDD